jgi:hypothetical protein
MLGKLTLLRHLQPSACALGSSSGGRRLVAADDGVAAEQLAGVAGQAAVQAVGEEAHRRQRGHGQHHRHRQQAQFAGAEVAQLVWRQASRAIEGRRKDQERSWRRPYP